MKVSVFIGSPRKEGNTSDMAGLLAQELKNYGIDTGLFHLNDYQVEACMDCRACQTNKLGCVRSDEMKPLYQVMEQSDVLIFGTPIYWFGPSGKTKQLIDRFRPYFVNKKLYGKKAGLLISSSEEGDTELTIEQFRRVFKALGMEYLDAITVEAYNKGEALSNHKIHDFITDLKDRILEDLPNSYG